MKKFLTTLMSLLLLLALVGCNTPNMPTGTTVPTVTEPSPPETTLPEPAGTLKADLLQNVDPDKFGQTYQITIDAKGEKVALYTDGMIHDLLIEYGSMGLEDNAFTPEYTVFSAKSMSPDSLIIICTYFPDLLPNLRVQYTGAEGNITRFLFQSGKDGSILLTEN